MIVGDIKAVNDLWIIGDQFVNDVYYILSGMKQKAISSKKGKLPYIFEYYNVSCFTPNPNTILTDVLARMVNCLIKALNDAVKIPCLILVIPDEDIMTFIDYPGDGSGSKFVFGGAITWIVNQMT